MLGLLPPALGQNQVSTKAGQEQTAGAAQIDLSDARDMTSRPGIFIGGHLTTQGHR
jgi:hypothetical protein